MEKLKHAKKKKKILTLVSSKNPFMKNKSSKMC